MVVAYEELLARSDAPSGSAWGVFGPQDEIGTLNHVTPERVAAASRLIRRGVCFNLDYDLHAFRPKIGHRHPPKHNLFQNDANHRDDYLDRFFLQATSHIDGLRHIRHPVHGFYNGFQDAAIGRGQPTLGMNRWAERGIVGRGVLLDVARYRESIDSPIQHSEPTPISTADLENTARLQHVSLQPGDLLMIRTGWASHVLKQRHHGMFDPSAPLRSPGLEQSNEMVAWLWERQVGGVFADNLAVEVFPVSSESPFILPFEKSNKHKRSTHTGMMHRILIPLLGMVLGELWRLEDVAKDCASDGVWECFLTSKPLFLVGGVGSPANALAIK